MEGEIGKDSSDNRGEKVEERQDHLMVQQVEENELVDLIDGNDIEPENVDEVVSDIEE